LKWFRKREMGKGIFAAGLGMAAGALALGAVGLTASASLVAWQNPGFLLGAGNGIARWLENAESGSGVEKALYRLMKLPGRDSRGERRKRISPPGSFINR